MSSHVSVIIVNYNSGHLLVRCLEALARQTRQADRIVVVDNNSQDDSLSHLPQVAGLEIIRSESNSGFAKANNLAVSQIHDSDFIVLLNPDAFAETNWLENLLHAAEENPEKHFFASKMLNDQERNIYDGAGDLYHISGRPRRRFYRCAVSDIDSHESRSNENEAIFSPCGGAAMYRRSVFQELGGFDESFFCYLEDIDLGFRMQLRGYTGLYVPDAVVYHIGSAISGIQSDFSVYHGHRNLVWAYIKNMPLPILLITLPYHLLLNMLSIVYFVYRGQGRVILKAKKDALLGIPEILKKRHQVQSNRLVSNRYVWSILDKKISNFVFYPPYFFIHTSPGEHFKQFQNFFKVGIKKTIFAPYIYSVVFSLHRLKNILQQVLISSQNTPSTQHLASEREKLLMSQEHISWLTQRQQHKNFPMIDLSVVTFNSTAWITNFTKSLMTQNYPLGQINLFFVDNDSTDNTRESLVLFSQQFQEKFASLRIEKRSNHGFGSGHDFSIRHSQSDYILVCNIDMEFTADAIVEVLAMATTDDMHIASWELRQKPFEHPKYYDPVTLETSWSSHACILLRRSAYETVGGYESAIFMYGEDVELSYRFRRAGYRLKYNPFAVVFHYSYNQINEVKPLQFSGSALSNVYIRLAYGTLYDQLMIIPLQMAKLLKGSGVMGGRKSLLKNFNKILSDYSYFRTKNVSGETVYYPFRGFDYEMKRDGAFYQCGSLDEDNLPLVSIVTRTYKGRQNWLKECIVSVMNQTYPNIQHVIVEDGGSTMQFLMDKISHCYGDNHSYNYSYHALSKVGRSCAGNKGLELADGQWLMFLDDDDLLLSDHVETLILAVLNNAELDAAYSLSWDVQTQIQTYVRVGEDEKQADFNYLEKIFSTPQRYRQEFSLKRLFEENYMPIQAIMFKRQLFELYGGFDEDIDYLEDWLLWTKYAMNHKFKYVPKTTSLFRTPYSLQEQIKRKLAFDEGYDEVIAKQLALKQ